MLPSGQKEKTVAASCLTRNKAVERAPLAGFCVCVCQRQAAASAGPGRGRPQSGCVRSPRRPGPRWPAGRSPRETAQRGPRARARGARGAPGGGAREPAGRSRALQRSDPVGLGPRSGALRCPTPARNLCVCQRPNGVAQNGAPCRHAHVFRAKPSLTESQRDSCFCLTRQSPGAASAGGADGHSGPSAWRGNPGLGEAPLANGDTPARPQAPGLGSSGAVPPPLPFSSVIPSVPACR